MIRLVTQSENKLQEMAHVDKLTGLYNRHYMLEQLELSDANKNDRCVAIADIDSFKQINDTYGHNEGDYALKIVSNILFKVFSCDSSIGRFGGDEFCVVSCIDSQDELEERLDLVEDELDKWNYKNERPYKLEISMGSMIYNPVNAMTVKQFQIAIDELMYIQKRKHHLADNRR